MAVGHAGLVHPGLGAALVRHFGAACTVLAGTEGTPTPLGTPAVTYTAVATMTDLRCTVPAVPGKRLTRLDAIQYTIDHREIVLASYQPTITTAHRVTTGGAQYQIDAVMHDSQGAFTTLLVRAVQ